MSNNAWNSEYNAAKGSLLAGNGTRPIVRTVGADGQVLTADSTQTDGIKWAAASGSNVSLSPYIVGAVKSDFTTIGAAVTQAIADGASTTNPINIYIKPGPYTENVTLADGINLVGEGGVGGTLVNGIATEHVAVQIAGTLTFGNGQNRVCNLAVISTAAGIIFNGTTGDLFFTVQNCYISAANASNFINFQQGVSVTVACDNTVFVSQGTSNVFSTTASGTYLVNLQNCLMFANDASQNVIASTATLTLQLFGSSAITPGFTSTNATSITVSGSWSQIFSGSNNLRDASSGVICTIGFDNSFMQVVNIMNNTNASSQIQLRNVILSQDGTQGYTCGGSVNFLNCTAATQEVFRANSTNGYKTSNFYTGQGRVQTTNAVLTTIATIPLQVNQAVSVRGEVTGFQSTFAGAVGGSFEIVARRSGGGAVQVGLVSANVQTDIATAAFLPTVSGNNVIVQVSGVLATTINWVCLFEYLPIIDQT